jgi:hypothetical protein
MDTSVADRLHEQIETHAPRPEAKVKTYLATPTNFFGLPASPEDLEDRGLSDMSKNAPDAMLRGMAQKNLNTLALQSLDGGTMDASNYCETIISTLKTKIFLLENADLVPDGPCHLLSA